MTNSIHELKVLIASMQLLLEKEQIKELIDDFHGVDAFTVKQKEDIATFIIDTFHEIKEILQ